MDAKNNCADLVIKANALKAVATVFSDTFTSGTEEDVITAVTAQTDTFSYLVYVISDYVNEIVKKAEDIENQLNTD